jgi:hypothetical protein
MKWRAFSENVPKIIQLMITQSKVVPESITLLGGFRKSTSHFTNVAQLKIIIQNVNFIFASYV